jgi:hypothetical protein
MPLRYIFIALAVTFAAITPTIAKPNKKVTGAQLLSRASLSFSKVPFDTPRQKIKIPLMIKDKSCVEINECEYTDANNITYIFWDEDEALVAKSLNVSDFIGKSIGALGIGMAREKNQVLNKASAFLGGTKYSCTKSVDPSQKIENSSTSCSWTLGLSFASVEFNKKGQLVDVYVQGWQYT